MRAYMQTCARGKRKCTWVLWLEVTQMWWCVEHSLLALIVLLMFCFLLHLHTTTCLKHFKYKGLWCICKHNQLKIIWRSKHLDLLYILSVCCANQDVLDVSNQTNGSATQILHFLFLFAWAVDLFWLCHQQDGSRRPHYLPLLVLWSNMAAPLGPFVWCGKITTQNTKCRGKKC